MKKWVGSIPSISLAMLPATQGCSPASKNVRAVYVSPLQYEAYGCGQIEMEYRRVAAKVTEVAYSQDSAANKDAAAMTVGVVVFWPALFFLIGGNRKAELEQLKGQADALEQAAIEKNCCDMVTWIEISKNNQAAIETAQRAEQIKNSPPPDASSQNLNK